MPRAQRGLGTRPRVGPRGKEPVVVCGHRVFYTTEKAEYSCKSMGFEPGSVGSDPGELLSSSVTLGESLSLSASPFICKMGI